MIQKRNANGLLERFRPSLEKLGLIDYMTLSLDIDILEFVKRLKAQVDESNLGIMSDVTDPFSSSRNEFKGEVDRHGFKIKRRRKLFDVNANIAVAKGHFRQEREQLIIDIEIDSLSRQMVFFYLIITFAYISLFTTMIAFGSETDMPVFVLPFMLIHAALMFGIPYFLMRRSVKRMKYELERELFFIANK